jgi:hypothetical protein
MIMRAQGTPHQLLHLGVGDGTFQKPSAGLGDFTLEKPIVDMVSGDFNGDGKLDLAVDNYDYSNITNKVTILLGNGDGTFRAPTTFSTGFDQISSMVAGDFDGDGKLDLALAGGEGVIVLLNNGNGTFQAPVQYAAGLFPVSLVAGDFNGDGRLDLATANYGSNDVAILLNEGHGVFQPARQYPVGSASGYLVAGDFNRDGRLDLVVDSVSQFNISVLVGNGDGTFQRPQSFSDGNSVGAMVAGDFDGDGQLDLAVADTPSDGVSILLGNGDGTFRPRDQFAVGFFLQSLIGRDFNRDGRLDLAVAGYGPNGDGEIAVLLGNGDGTFQPARVYPVPGGGTFLASADFNGDGRPDIVVDDYSDPFTNAEVVSVLLGKGDGTFQLPLQAEVGYRSFNFLGSASTLVSGNFNGDSLPGMASVQPLLTDISVQLSTGQGTFAAPGQLAITPQARPLVADLNGNGTDDVLVVDRAGNILYRRGVPHKPATFEPPVTVNPAFPSRDITFVSNTALGPVIASVDAKDNAVSLYACRDGVFIRVGSLTTGSLPAQIIAADLAGDGRDDLVVRNAGDGTLSVFFNGGPGGSSTGIDPFLPPVTLQVGLGVCDVQAIDTMGAGTLDLVVTNKLTGRVSILRNLGDGTFAAPAPYRAGTGLSGLDTSAGSHAVTSLEATAGVAAGPLTPGDPTSLVTINPGSNTLDVLAGLGQGRFANPVAVQTQSPAQVVRVADFNHDGRLDLAILSADGVSIYLGNGKGGLALPVTYDAGPDPTGLTIADVNHDDNPDLLVGNSYGDVLVLLGKGDGTFQPYHKTDQAIELAVTNPDIARKVLKI